MPTFVRSVEGNTAPVAKSALHADHVLKYFKLADPGVEICYEVFGKETASKKILMISGLNSLGCIYKIQAAYFGQVPDYQICYFDNRGVGDSSSPPGRYTTKQLAEDALALIKHLDWTNKTAANGGRVNVVGTSMGGMIAQELALLAPEHIETVVLASTHAGTFFNSPSAIWNLPRLALTKDPDAKLDIALSSIFPSTFLAQKGPPNSEFDTQLDYMKALMIGFVAGKPLQQKQGIFGQIAAATLHRMPAERLSNLRSLYCSEGLPRIMVITGTNDKIISPHHSLYLADKLQSRLEVFVGSGHALFLEQPDRVNALIRAFVDQVHSKGTIKVPVIEQERLEKYVPTKLSYYNLVKVEKPKKDESLPALKEEASREAI